MSVLHRVLSANTILSTSAALDSLLVQHWAAVLIAVPDNALLSSGDIPRKPGSYINKDTEIC